MGTFNAANQQTLITPPSGVPTTRSFDGNGNLIKAVTGSAATTQTWSPENKLVGLVSPALNESYLCSDDGLRKQETTASGTALFTYDDVLVLLETTPGGVLQARNTDYPGEFGGLASQNRGGASSYYGYDALGSVRILVSTAGVVTDEYSNTAFGEPIQPGSGTPNPHVYVGLMRYRLQSDGSYLLSVRLLDPVTGRFTSVDELGLAGGSYNEFEYVGNEPVGMVDPSGMQHFNRPGPPGTGAPTTGGTVPGLRPSCPKPKQPRSEGGGKQEGGGKKEGPELCLALLCEVKPPKATEYFDCIKECAEKRHDLKQLAQCIMSKCAGKYAGGEITDNIRSYACCLAYSSRTDGAGQWVQPCPGDSLGGTLQKKCCGFRFCSCVANRDAGFLRLSAWADAMCPGRVVLDCGDEATKNCGLSDSDWSPGDPV